MGFFSSFHPDKFSTHINQCGSCGHSTVLDSSLKCRCNKRNAKYPLDSPACRYYVKDNSRDYRFWEKIYTYYVLTAIFDILEIDRGNIVYEEIRTLIDLVRIDKSTIEEANSYDAFGLDLAIQLRSDPDRVEIANFLLQEYIVKIYAYIGLNRQEDAIELFKEMVNYLFIRYRNINNYADNKTTVIDNEEPIKKI